MHIILAENYIKSYNRGIKETLQRENDVVKIGAIMNLERLRSTLYEMIKEQQIKLGYVYETVRLYFPKTSLCNILDLSSTDSEEELKKAISMFKEEVKDELGEVIISRNGDRFCISVAAQGSQYIHEHVLESPFLGELIALFRQHNITIEDVKQVFEKTRLEYVCATQDGEEFDYLIHFLDKKEDPYYYCVKFDDGHASYHRFHEFDIKSILD